MKVSKVSVSRRASAPHFGQAVSTNSGRRARGEPPPSMSTSSGSSTGSRSSGTGTMPQASQCTMGTGQPQ